MRVNVYAEEMTDRVEIIEKNGFTGLRFYLELPASFIPGAIARAATVEDTVQAEHYQAPFIHHPGDDDSAAVTFWGKRDLRKVLVKALEMLDRYYPECGHQPSDPKTGYHCLKCGIQLPPEPQVP